jgi:hypothetical protein
MIYLFPVKTAFRSLKGSRSTLEERGGKPVALIASRLRLETVAGGTALAAGNRPAFFYKARKE